MWANVQSDVLIAAYSKYSFTTDDHFAEVLLNLNKRYVVALALTSFAVALSTYLTHRRNLQTNARELQNALEVWENEGGILLSSTPKAADA